MCDGVIEQMPEIRTYRRLATADVYVEHLHALKLIDDCLALLRRELARIAAAGGGQAVHAGEIACVGEFPGQADRSVESELKLLDERATLGSRLSGDVRHGRSPVFS